MAAPGCWTDNRPNLGTHASAGIRNGEVSNLDALSNAIGKTVQVAERDAGIEIQSVTVVAPGGTPFSSIRKPVSPAKRCSGSDGAILIG